MNGDLEVCIEQIQLVGKISDVIASHIVLAL